MLTGLVVGLVSAMSLIRERPEYLWPGLALLAPGAACGDLASVPYNAMLRQLSTPQNSGRISGFGLAAAFVGSVGLLLLVYFGCIDGKGPTRGFLQLPVGDGMNVRIAMLLAAGWFVVFATPLLLTAHGCRRRRRPSVPPGRAGRLPQALAGPGRRMAPRTATSFTTCWPRRFFETVWQAYSRSAACSASTHTGSRRPTS